MNKTITFLRNIFLSLIFIGPISGQVLYAQVDTGTGTGWGKLEPTDPMVLNERFQGFKFFHSDSTSDMGNSDNRVDEVTGAIIPGYMDLDTSFYFLGTNKFRVHYQFDTCAFAPQWPTAYAQKNGTVNTEGVSNGFVEISRKFTGTTRGYFTIDLRELDFVSVIQYSHSSTGGNKRGLTLQYSIDNGTTWDTLRYQSGNINTSFDADIFTKERRPNAYRCDPSAYGMLWEDAVYSDNLMLRFLESAGQTVRVHDLKVYATFKEGEGLNRLKNNLGMRIMDGNITFSREINVKLYTLSGMLVKTGAISRELYIGDLSKGIYIVKASFDGQVVSKKIVVRQD